MSGQRRGPVGAGYMPKGGAKAAQVHNERRAAARQAEADVAAPSPVESASKTVEVRADARASGWPAVTRPDRRLLVGAVAASSVSAVASVLSLVVR